MTGTEKIIGRINLDSAKKCESIVNRAELEASEMIAQAKAEGERLLNALIEKANAQADEIVQMAQSGTQQKAGQITLAARIEAVNETLSAAVNAFRQLPPEEYFRALSALAAQNAMPGTCEMRLSPRDLERLPHGFEAEINAALAEKESSVKIIAKPAAIKDGFILVYGDIEINCAFEALIEAKRDELKEIVCDIIFQ